MSNHSKLDYESMLTMLTNINIVRIDYARYHFTVPITNR